MAHDEKTTFFGTIDASAAAQATVQEGRRAAREHEYERAITYYTNGLQFVGTSALFKARVYEYRGECHWLLSHFAAAEADYQQSLTISDDPEQIARARVRLGEIADFRGNYTESETIYRQALSEGTAVNNLLVIGRARRGLGILSRRKGNTEQAVSHLTQGLIAFRQVGAALEQARVLTSLGRTRHARGEYQLALTAHHEALTILESLSERWRVIQALNDIGECHQVLYDIANALKYHQQALEMAEADNIDLLKPEIQRNLGIDLIEYGQVEEGRSYLETALSGARQLGNREQEALTLYHLARVYLRQNQLDKADTAVSQLDDIAENLDADRYRALAGMARGELLFTAGKQKEAVVELNNAMLEAQTSVDRGMLWKLHAIISHAVDNEAIAAVHQTIAAEFIRQTAEPLQDPHLKSSFVYAPPVLAILQAAGIDPDKL